MENDIIKRNCLIAVTILWIIVIFSFSLQPADVSSDTSMGFARKLLSVFLPGFLDYMEQMSAEQLDNVHYIIRKCAHFTEYFVLGILIYNTVVEVISVRRTRSETAKKNDGRVNIKVVFFSAMIFCVFIASIDETIQLFVSGRSGRIVDVLLDSAGAAAGILLYCVLVRKFLKFVCT